ncbi:MAG: hypothetical protein ACP5E3_03690 [Bacteroidales bacterium]
MQSIKKLFITALLSLFIIPGFSHLHAQTSDINSILDTLVIEDQFDYIFERSSRYEQYKVIREVWLNQFMENLEDTVNGLRSDINELESTVNSKDQQISTLENQLTSTQGDLEESIKERNSFDVFGLKIDKVAYNIIMWIIVAALIFILVVVFLLYKRSHAVTRDNIQKYETLQSEYDEFRNNARLKMEKVKREHLNEIMKLKSGQ